MIGSKKMSRFTKSAALGIFLTILIMFPMKMKGQGFAISGQVTNSQGRPAAFATIRVCPYTGSGLPCSPLSSLSSNLALTQGISNPYSTDENGNFSFFVGSNATYILQITVDGKVYSYFVSAGNGGGGGGVTFQTNGTSNNLQNILNFETSTVNSDGLTITPSNPSGGIEKFEINGSYTGNAATATNISSNGTANQVWGMNSGATAQGWQTVSGGEGGTVTYTASQTASSADAGKLVIMNCSSACAYTLPATQPSPTWATAVTSHGSTVATIALGGSDTFNGSTTVPVLLSFTTLAVAANTAVSTDYSGSVPLVAGAGTTFTPSSNGLSIATSGGAGAFLLNPTTSQTVAMPSNTTTGLNLTTSGNVASTQLMNWELSDNGHGWDCGNGSTNCQDWRVGGGLVSNAISNVRGIFDHISGETVRDAIGDSSFLSFFNQCYGGVQAPSDEACVWFRMHNFQRPYFSGPLIQPSVGSLNQPFVSTHSGTTYIWPTCGEPTCDGGFPSFASGGVLQTFSIIFNSASGPATAQNILIGLGTVNSNNTFTTSGTPISVAIPAGESTITFTPAQFGTVNVAAGQTIYAFVPTGNGAAGAEITPFCIAGAPSAGTFPLLTGSSCPGGFAMNMEATLSAPTTGAATITASPLSCNGFAFACTDISIGNFADGGILLDTTRGGSTAVIGQVVFNAAVGGLQLPLTSGTVPVSSAWGILDGSSCTGNGNGKFQNYTATTCNVTLGTSPASPGNFVTSGSITSCPAAGGSITGTSLDIGLSGPFAEEAYVIAVGTPSAGVQSITFCTRYAWNSSTQNTLVMQGGPIGQSMVATSVIGTWPVAYALVGATSATSLYYSDCLVGVCNGGLSTATGNSLPPTTAVTFFPSSFIIGNQNGTAGAAELATNTVPFTIGDSIVGAPTSEFEEVGLQDICGQGTPINGSIPSTCMDITEAGLAPMPYITFSSNFPTSNPVPFGLDFPTGAVNTLINLGIRPTSGFFVTGGAGSTSTYTLMGDAANSSNGIPMNLTYTPSNGKTELSKNGTDDNGIFVTGTFIGTLASQFAAGTTFGGVLPCLQNGTDCPSLTGTTPTITGTALTATCDSGVVTVSGATVGHPVGVSGTTGADVGGAFTLRASVTATNTVTVFVCGTGTPPSLAYNVITQ
jgi:hypothetical protein